MIEEIGVVSALQKARGNTILEIDARLALGGMRVGDSVAVSGPCLTVTKLNRARFAVEATERTMQATTISQWRVGSRVNLEQPLKLGDRLGGHIVQGHIDATGRVTRVSYHQGSMDIFIEAPPSILNRLPDKGSVAVDGVSLTVAGKSPPTFQVMIIPITQEKTTLGSLRPGDRVNIETDLIIRWLAQAYNPLGSAGGIDLEEWNGIHLED